MTRRKGRPNKRQRAGSNSSNQSQSPNQPTKSARFDLLSPYPEANQEETFTMDNEKLSKLIADTVTQAFSPRARGVLFVLKGPYDPRVPPIVKFSQESESARLTKIILSKSTVKTF